MPQRIAIDLGDLGRTLMRALVEDDPEERRAAVLTWQGALTETVQREMPAALARYCADTLDDWAKVGDAYRKEVLADRLKQPVGFSMYIRLGTPDRRS